MEPQGQRTNDQSVLVVPQKRRTNDEPVSVKNQVRSCGAACVDYIDLPTSCGMLHLWRLFALVISRRGMERANDQKMEEEKEEEERKKERVMESDLQQMSQTQNERLRCWHQRKEIKKKENIYMELYTHNHHLMISTRRLRMCMMSICITTYIKCI